MTGEDIHGYDVDFITTPSINVLCAICQCTFKEPTQVNPCGHIFCKECIELLMNSGNRNNKRCCPICNCHIQKIFPDKNRERIVLNMRIKCVNNSKECAWTGELRHLETHLENCDYLEIPCTNENCKEKVNRGNLESHKKICQHRIVLCNHCSKNYVSTHQKEHEENCEKQPLRCKNECGETIARDEMEKHLDEECKNTIHQCKYFKIGCQEGGTRSWLKKHEETATKNHLSHAVDKLEECEIRITQLTQKFDYLYSLRSQEPSKSSKPFIYSINNFAAKFETTKQNNDYILSDSFYCFDGYKIQLKVYLNGHGGGCGTHVTAGFLIVKGPFDDLLDWPFKGNIRLLVQGNGKKDIKWECDTTKVSLEDIVVFQRPKCVANLGMGCPCYIKHDVIKNYIKDNCLAISCHVEQRN